MNETASPETNNSDSIFLKEYRWSTYAFIIDFISFTSLNALIVLLLFMHRDLDSAVDYKTWVIALVGIILELVFVFFSILDARRKNPLEKTIGSRIFNLPVLAITVIVTAIIFWGDPNNTFAIVYGSICGGFAGYLAGGLAYANFFIKFKDEVFRTIFGGWVGVLIGAIMGSVFAYLVDPFGGQVFGGIFMGFWGGAIVSGPIAVVLLHLLKGNEKFANFFTKIVLYGTIRNVASDMQLYFSNEENKTLDLTQCKVLEETVDKKTTPEAPAWVHRLIILFATILLFSATLLILVIFSMNDMVTIKMFQQNPGVEIAGLVVSIVFIVATIIGTGVFGAKSPNEWWQGSDITQKQKVLQVYLYTLFLYNPWEIDESEKRQEAFTKVFEFAAEKQGYTIEENVISK